jgi:hypothetical protein
VSGVSANRAKQQSGHVFIQIWTCFVPKVGFFRTASRGQGAMRPDVGEAGVVDDDEQRWMVEIKGDCGLDGV